MAYGAIELSTISRAQDFTTIKQNEDNKGFVEQTNLGQQAQRTEEHRANSVNSSDDVDWKNKKHDARDKGNNEYSGDGGKNRKRQNESDRVVIKGRGSFDMKI